MQAPAAAIEPSAGDWMAGEWDAKRAVVDAASDAADAGRGNWALGRCMPARTHDAGVAGALADFFGNY